MSLGHGRPYLAIPGPSVMPDRVIRAMMRPAPNIYHGELTDMVPGLIRDLKDVARTAQISGMIVIKMTFVLPSATPLGKGNRTVNTYMEYTMSKRRISAIKPSNTASLTTLRCGLTACCAEM